MSVTSSHSSAAWCSSWPCAVSSAWATSAPSGSSRLATTECPRRGGGLSSWRPHPARSCPSTLSPSTSLRPAPASSRWWWTTASTSPTASGLRPHRSGPSPSGMLCWTSQKYATVPSVRRSPTVRRRSLRSSGHSGVVVPCLGTTSARKWHPWSRPGCVTSHWSRALTGATCPMRWCDSRMG
uniref:Putative hcg2042888 isoform cra a n=1 Tax=Ixodes ricinus TaxID=34613 RepID=A0A147BB37_IXORI